MWFAAVERGSSRLFVVLVGVVWRGVADVDVIGGGGGGGGAVAAVVGQNDAMPAAS